MIDLLVVYTEGYGDPLRQWRCWRASTTVAQANTGYLNSEVAITLRLVATYRSSYSETTTDGQALDHITPSIPWQLWTRGGDAARTDRSRAAAIPARPISWC